MFFANIILVHWNFNQDNLDKQQKRTWQIIEAYINGGWKNYSLVLAGGDADLLSRFEMI
jgi:hypothetical protein